MCGRQPSQQVFQLTISNSGFKRTDPSITVDGYRPMYGGTCYSPAPVGTGIRVTQYNNMSVSATVTFTASTSGANVYAHPIDGYALQAQETVFVSANVSPRFSIRNATQLTSIGYCIKHITNQSCDLHRSSIKLRFKLKTSKWSYSRCSDRCRSWCGTVGCTFVLLTSSTPFVQDYTSTSSRAGSRWRKQRRTGVHPIV